MVTNIVVHPGMPRTDHLMRERVWRSYLDSMDNAGSDDDVSAMLVPDKGSESVDIDFLKILETVHARLDGTLKNFGYVADSCWLELESIVGQQGTVRLHGSYVGRCVDHVAEQVAAVRKGVSTRKTRSREGYMALPDEQVLEDVVEGVDVEYGTVFLRHDDPWSQICEGLHAEDTTYFTGRENTVPRRYAVSDVRRTVQDSLEPILELAT